jgi:hypothetical protein
MIILRNGRGEFFSGFANYLTCFAAPFLPDPKQFRRSFGGLAKVRRDLSTARQESVPGRKGIKERKWAA